MEKGHEQLFGLMWFLGCGFPGPVLAWGFLVQMAQSCPPYFSRGWGREFQGRTSTHRCPSPKELSRVRDISAPGADLGWGPELCGRSQTSPSTRFLMSPPDPGSFSASGRQSLWGFSSFPIILPSMCAQMADTELL